MGDFRITIEAVGGHGCERDATQGEQFYGCGRMGCPDCEARRFVEEFNRRCPVSKAVFTHWPADMKDRNYPEDAEVQDDLAPRYADGSMAGSIAPYRVRIKGSFKSG